VRCAPIDAERGTLTAWPQSLARPLQQLFPVVRRANADLRRAGCPALALRLVQPND